MARASRHRTPRLPEDLEAIVPADLLARGRPELDRKELKKTRVMLWANARGVALIGDQDSVAAERPQAL
jgi:hypothetical protein